MNDKKLDDLQGQLEGAAERNRVQKLREVRSGALLTMGACSGVIASYFESGWWDTVGLGLAIWLLAVCAAIMGSADNALERKWTE